MTAADDGSLLDSGECLLGGGLLWCRVCAQPRHPAPGVDGARSYSCGPSCPVPDTHALAVEQAATLAALVRAHTVLYAIGRQPPVVFHSPPPELWKTNGRPPQVTTEEIRRWESCDFTNRRAVLRTAYHRLEVDKDGVIHRIWRHQNHQPTEPTQRTETGHGPGVTP